MTNITYGTFLLFATSVVIGMLVVWFFMPETKGLSMEEMDILFGVKGSALKKRRETERIIDEKRLNGEPGAVALEKQKDAMHLENV